MIGLAHRPALRAALGAVGAALLLTSAGIHFDLYVTGYRSIPTIGPLFLLQSLSAIVAAVAVLVVRTRLVMLGAAALALSTVGGYALSRAVGLFGFHEVVTTAGLVAGLVETTAFGVFAVLGTAPGPGLGTDPARLGWLFERSSRPVLRAAAAGTFAAALVVTLLAGTGSPRSSVSATAPTGSTTGEVRVVIENFAFTPNRIRVRPGEMIVVTNKDPTDHTFTAIPRSSPFGHFDTGDIAPNQTKSLVAPLHPGSYAFYCSIHNFMTGVVTVVGD